MEIPEIVVKYRSVKSTPESCRRYALKKLKELNIKAWIWKEGLNGHGLYVFNCGPVLTKGHSWNIDLRWKIPIPHSFNSVVDYPRPDYWFMAWELDFPVKVVHDYLDIGRFDSILTSFLLGREIINQDYMRKAEKKKVYDYLFNTVIPLDDKATVRLEKLK